MELLRKCDVHAKDPSTTRKLIRQWVEQVDSLFRDGNIFRVAPSTAAGMHGPIAPLAPCTQKTATQIALEQIEYISEVDYVGRVRDFMAASPKDLLQRGMEQMHAVIGPAKERMAADFTDSDLYMAMDIFDLDEWEPLVPIASTQSLLSAPGTSALRLARNLRTILDN